MASGEITIADHPRASLAARLGVAGLLATVAMVAGAFVIQLSTENAWIADAYGFPGFTSLFALSCATVGAVIVSRRPSNLVGRVLLAAGLIAAFQSLYTEYAIASYLGTQGPLPLAPLAAWLLSWAWLPFVFLAGPLLMSIFPDGQFLSPRWRLVLAIVAVIGAAWAVVSALKVGPLENFAVLENPFGVVPPDVAGKVAGVLAPGMALGFILPAASLVVRYRRSDAERRQQLKWIAAAGVLLAVVAPAGFSLGKTGQLLFIVAFCSLPIATGIAVLRYRLYEIDTIINRALVYGLLTAIIAGIYTASIGVMQRLSNTFLGGSSEATIVVTTVVIVTAFTPIKARLQALVDRRFKGAGDAKAMFDAFEETLKARTWLLDERLTLRRFADASLAALRATSVELSLQSPDRPAMTVLASGTDAAAGSAVATWSTTSSVGTTTIRLRVTTAGRELPERDRQAAGEALEALATELGEP